MNVNLKMFAIDSQLLKWAVTCTAPIVVVVLAGGFIYLLGEMAR